MITVELRNGAIRGNTHSQVIEIPDEYLEDYDQLTQEQVINETVDDTVTGELVYWDWKEVNDGTSAGD